MKNVYTLLIAFFVILMFAGCSPENNDAESPSTDVKMTAKVINVGEFVEVEVTESDYTSGIHWVITSEDTVILNKYGFRASRNDLSPNQEVEITYSGQVMMSYPPKIVARKIKMK